METELVGKTVLRESGPRYLRGRTKAASWVKAWTVPSKASSSSIIGAPGKEIPCPKREGSKVDRDVDEKGNVKEALSAQNGHRPIHIVRRACAHPVREGRHPGQEMRGICVDTRERLSL